MKRERWWRSGCSESNRRTESALISALMCSKLTTMADDWAMRQAAPRQTHTHRERERDIHTDRQTDRQTDTRAQTHRRAQSVQRAPGCGCQVYV
jgi:hypothetical protein